MLRFDNGDWFLEGEYAGLVGRLIKCSEKVTVWSVMDVDRM